MTSEVIKLLPINIGEYTIRLINYDDLDWYANNMTLDYFNEYIDNKASKSNIKKMKYALKNMIIMYNMKLKNDVPVRTIIMHGDEIVGGITIFKSGVKGIELGYWVIPAFQNKGIATKVIKDISDYYLEHLNINKVDLIIQSKNDKSIHIALNCGFRYVTSEHGKYGYNYIFSKERI